MIVVLIMVMIVNNSNLNSVIVREGQMGEH